MEYVDSWELGGDFFCNPELNYMHEMKVLHSGTISIIVPLFNEENSLKTLYEEIKDAFEGVSGEFEVLFVNDGSLDGSQNVLDAIAKEDEGKHVRVAELKRNFGKATALNAGFSLAKGGGRDYHGCRFAG